MFEPSRVGPGKRNRSQTTKGLTNLNATKKPERRPVEIIVPTPERKLCVCGAALIFSRDLAEPSDTGIWRCNRHCGARGLSYEGALRRKLRLDLLSWGDLRRKARALVAAEKEDRQALLSSKASKEQLDTHHSKSTTRTDTRALEYRCL